MTVSELYSRLNSCFVTIRKSSGEEYEPGSLISLKRSIDRYLKEIIVKSEHWLMGNSRSQDRLLRQKEEI